MRQAFALGNDGPSPSPALPLYYPSVPRLLGTLYMKWVRGLGPLLSRALSQNLSPPSAAISTNWYPGHPSNGRSVMEWTGRTNYPFASGSELIGCVWSCSDPATSAGLRRWIKEGFILWGCQTRQLRKVSPLAKQRSWVMATGQP